MVRFPEQEHSFEVRAALEDPTDEKGRKWKIDHIDHTRPIGVRDRYILRLSGDPDRRIDRRVAVALAVALDALQSR